MQFKDVVGQEELKSHIISLIQKNQLPHAILLLGAEGTGGLPLAWASAQYLMCQNKQSHDSCGECSQCTKVKNLQHPDLHFSFPFSRIKERKPICNDYYGEFRNFILDAPYATVDEWIQSIENDKQGNITADECRDILRKLLMRPYESEFKIMIIWRPEYMGNEGNILLKFIEEPTAKTILFLVTENLEKVIATIQSRSQLFPLKRLAIDDIKQALMKHDIPEPRAVQFARLSEGNFHKALSLTHSIENDFLIWTRAWLNAIFQNNGLEILKWSDEIAEQDKDSQKNFLSYFIQLLEHTIRYRLLGASNMLLLDQEQKVVENLIAKGLETFAIEDITNAINEAISQIERNANTKILFHALSLRIQQVILRKKATA
jgi:DNA polymerase-3 subunit delta'